MTTPETPGQQPYTTGQPAYLPQEGYGQPGPATTGRRGQRLRQGPGWFAYFVTIIALLLVVAVIVFVVQNDQSIQIKFFSLNYTFSRSAFALAMAGGAGFVAGLLLGLVPAISARRKLRALRRSQGSAAL